MNTPTRSTIYDQRAEAPWWLVLLGGIAALIIGLLMLSTPIRSIIFLVQFLGFYWLISGIFALVGLFLDQTDWIWKLVSGILGIIAGMIVIENPIWSAILVPGTLIILLGLMGVVIGAIQVFEAFRGAGPGIGILGALSIILGIILLFRPWAAALASPWVIAWLAIIGGVFAIVNAFMVRGRQKNPPMPNQPIY